MMKKGHSTSWAEWGTGGRGGGVQRAAAGRSLREPLVLPTIWISISMEEKPGPGIAADPRACAKAGQDL